MTPHINVKKGSSPAIFKKKLFSNSLFTSFLTKQNISQCCITFHNSTLSFSFLSFILRFCIYSKVQLQFFHMQFPSLALPGSFESQMLAFTFPTTLQALLCLSTLNQAFATVWQSEIGGQEYGSSLFCTKITDSHQMHTNEAPSPCCCCQASVSVCSLGWRCHIK